MRIFGWFVSNKNSYKHYKKSILVVLSLLLIGCISACSSIEKIRSDSLFEQYCNEEGRVGQFIYERVALGEEFFRPIPTDAKELRRVDSIYFIDSDSGKLLLDKDTFKNSYIRNFWEKTLLSPVGPIYSLETTIIRKSDGKTLSKAVSLLNMLGKTRKHLPVNGVTCPVGKDSKGQPLSMINHRTLIEKTIYIKTI
ncbi:hypothetical protein [Colwellia sp. RSH04]|uniref:hypothetical protein n=1 Tax=Colwellia sp. RSH04 TaxID=2305464 RepID=UPI000E578C96|nr:hypothetical protein [Colwellia sp. RSH04]RHW77520.1 hypothetical protein D1094_00770 [Colwellia sp. RSH04]